MRRAGPFRAFALLTALASSAQGADSFVRRLAERALERGMVQEARGDIAQALTSYDEAVRTDVTLGAAALRLGGLRERMGDLDQAELLYDRAIAASDSGGDAYDARAGLRERAGRRREALADLSEAVARGPTRERLRLIGGWYVEARLWPAALSAWRALAASAEEAGNEAELREARLTVTALSWLAADADPVLAGATSPDWARRSLSRVARPMRDAHGVRKLTP